MKITKRQTTMRITPETLRRLHMLLNSTGMIESKKELVTQYSATGKTSSKDLTELEARALCQHLAKLPGAGRARGVVIDGERAAADVMRKKIIRFAHLMAWEVSPGGPADMGRIDRWCRERGYLKHLNKGFNSYTEEELPRLVSQFELMHNKFLEAPL